MPEEYPICIATQMFSEENVRAGFFPRAYEVYQKGDGGEKKGLDVFFGCVAQSVSDSVKEKLKIPHTLKGILLLRTPNGEYSLDDVKYLGFVLPVNGWILGDGDGEVMRVLQYEASSEAFARARKIHRRVEFLLPGLDLTSVSVLDYKNSEN